MLISMTVRNIALIESLTIEFHRGMHVLSGETGAGKSILVDSINLVLGERADRSLIRSGCEKASVEALIDISDCPRAREILAEQELSDDHGLLTIQRRSPANEISAASAEPHLSRLLSAPPFRAAGGRAWAARAPKLVGR